MVSSHDAALQNELLSSPHVARVTQWASPVTVCSTALTNRVECLPLQLLTGLASPASLHLLASLLFSQPLVLPCPKCHKNGVTKHMAYGSGPLHLAKQAQCHLCCCENEAVPSPGLLRAAHRMRHRLWFQL